MFESFAAETAGRAAESGSGPWQLALIFMAIVLLGLFARWRRSRMPPLVPARELRARDGDPNRYRDAADRALVELLETGRALNAQADTKLRTLNRLVKDAEAAAARLESLLAESAAAAAAAAPPAPPEPSAAASARSFVSDLHERIHRLKREGRSSVEIAKATNLSTTEVEFIVKTLG